MITTIVIAVLATLFLARNQKSFSPPSPRQETITKNIIGIGTALLLRKIQQDDFTMDQKIIFIFEIPVITFVVVLPVLR